MSAPKHQPIIAIATAQGRAAVGIVRVSGPAIGPVIHALCGRLLKPREATYLPFLDEAAKAIDQGLALHFPAPHSYTGEEVLELQAHGGPLVLQLLLQRCLQAGEAIGLRIARPGEFTERAFLNGKIDLAQAEAIADLIDASTDAAARSAARSLSGAFSEEIHVLRDALIRLRMLVEATLDFPEEEIDFLQKADAKGQLDRLQASLLAVQRRAQQGALLREGIKVVIAGQPNAGKSSLLNALAGAELAIVTPVAGTTRDKIQQTIQIEGIPLHVIDTAGLRDSSDEVERIGIERAWDEIQAADAVLFLHDLTRVNDPAWAAADTQIAQRLPQGVPRIDVWNKLDLASSDLRPTMGVRLSAKSGLGLDALRQALLELVGWKAAPEDVFIARSRHLDALRRVHAHLAEAQAHLAQQAGALDLMAEELRLAQNALGEITGEFTADDLLGEIFSRFCIGK